MKAWERYIGVDPEICFGRPFLKSSGVPVWAVLSMLAAGVPVEQVKEEYQVSDDEILAIFAWAAHLARRKRVSLKARRRLKSLPVAP
jgi:uncharacterized protein (DUF433 family)